MKDKIITFAESLVYGGKLNLPRVGGEYELNIVVEVIGCLADPRTIGSDEILNLISARRDHVSDPIEQIGKAIHRSIKSE